MTVDDAVKQYRVMCWLERMHGKRERLAYLRDRIEEIDAQGDGLKCAKFRTGYTRPTSEPDRIGTMLVKREEARAKAVEEAASIAGELRDAARLLREARDANAGEADAAFAYTAMVYCKGVPAGHAARAVGKSALSARQYPRQVAAMVYDAAPDRFPPTSDERFAEHGFGYWAYASKPPK
jgi:hypothetical protein